jgi:hypothetical protein
MHQPTDAAGNIDVVSKFEKRLIQAAKEAVAFARGELDPKTYRVHAPADDNASHRVPAGALKIYHKSGPGRFVSRKVTRHRVARKKK